MKQLSNTILEHFKGVGNVNVNETRHDIDDYSNGSDFFDKTSEAFSLLAKWAKNPKFTADEDTIESVSSYVCGYLDRCDIDEFIENIDEYNDEGDEDYLDNAEDACEDLADNADEVLTWVKKLVKQDK